MADHIHPISKGGLSVIQNMVLVCSSCNQLKSDKLLRRFASQAGFNFNEICERLESLGKDA